MPRKTLAPRVAATLMVLLMALTASLLAAPGSALPKTDSHDPPIHCTANLSVRLMARLTPIRVVNRPVEVDASGSRLLHLKSDCDMDDYPITQHSWLLVTKPAQSSVTLAPAAPLGFTFTPDRGGSYVFRLFVPATRVGTMNFPATSQDFTVDVTSRYSVPPEMEPVVPAVKPATVATPFPDRRSRCLDGGGVVDPQWVVARPWTSAADYVQLDGLVIQSYVSRKDSPLNHDSQDTEIAVQPDPWSRHLVSTTPDQPDRIHVEWERNHIPELYRPSPGDRLTVWGYWINDCGHDPYYTEVHPPVGIATQRYRAIELGAAGRVVSTTPAGGWGQHCRVPGVLTEIWFDRESGEVMNNCSDTALHQRGYLESVPSGQSTAPRLNQLRSDPLVASANAFDFQGHLGATQGPATIVAEGRCLRSPSPINRSFEFDIFLPKNPRQVARTFGIDPPEPPLYIAIENAAGSGGFDPIVERRESGETSYLHVRIPLESFTAQRYSRRIYAGWALASPENWGLRAWRLSVSKLDVHDDGDGLLRGDGDWRFWIGTRNGFQEWTKIFDCDGCVTGTVTFGNRAWTTGVADAVSRDRWLGPDPLAFPGQQLLVQTTGFEDDTAVSDKLGAIVDWRLQSTSNYATRPPCSDSDAEIPGLVYSGCADYTMHYRIEPGQAPPSPSLTAQQQQLHTAYTVGQVPIRIPLPALAIQDRMIAATSAEDRPTRPAPGRAIAARPLIRRLSGTAATLRPVAAESGSERESKALTEISTAELKAKVTETLQRDPARAEAFLAALRLETDAARRRLGDAEVDADLAQLKQGIPDSLWSRYFATTRGPRTIRPVRAFLADSSRHR